MIEQKIGFVGAGQMATALVKGIIRAGLVSAGDLWASDPDQQARERFAAATGAKTLADNAGLVEQVDVVVLAVKPSVAASVLDQLAPGLGGSKLLVSIVAGVRIAKLMERLGSQARVVRVMPNTPCMVGCGASAFSRGGCATIEDARLVETLLGAVGLVVEVDERLLDAVTGLSGSGPAFVYLVIEALSDGGVCMGLPRATAVKLAAQTVLGAAQMVLSTGEHPAVLRDRVASPAGTTIAGIRALEAGGVRAALMAAVQAATQRSQELAGR